MHHNSVYRVRKACTESLVEVSKAIGPALSQELLIDVFLRLAEDSQKVVRNGVLQVSKNMSSQKEISSASIDFVLRSTSVVYIIEVLRTIPVPGSVSVC